MCLMSLVLYSTFIQRASDKVCSPVPVSWKHYDCKVKLFRAGTNGCNFQCSPGVSLFVLELNLACDLSPTCQKDRILSPKPLICHQCLFHALQSKRLLSHIASPGPLCYCMYLDWKSDGNIFQCPLSNSEDFFFWLLWEYLSPYFRWVCAALGAFDTKSGD